MTEIYVIGLAGVAIVVPILAIRNSKWRRRQARAARQKRNQELDRAFKRVAEERRRPDDPA